MVFMLFGWAIGVFLFLEIAMDWVFESDVSLTAALLIVVLEGAAVMLVTAVHSVHLLNYEWANGSLRKGFQTAVARTAVIFAATSLFQIVLARLIIFAFSKDLNREIQNFCQTGCVVHGTILWFGAIVTAPLLVQYAICIVGTYRTVRRP